MRAMSFFLLIGHESLWSLLWAILGLFGAVSVKGQAVVFMFISVFPALSTGSRS